MKISTIAKAILLPILATPLANSSETMKTPDKDINLIPKAAKDKNTKNPKTENQDRHIPPANIVFDQIDAPAIGTLALPRSIDPMSFALLSLSRKLDRKNHINEVVLDQKRFPESAKGKIDTYFGIDTENEGSFYIARKSNARPDAMFGVAYDEEDRKAGKLFLKAADEDMPVAIVPAKEAGLPGVFKIYEKNGDYEVSYDFHSMIWVPPHTKVGSTYLMHLENAMRKLPKELTKELEKQGVYVYTGEDYKDVYYKYYPHWEQEDRLKHWDPKLPVYEIRKDGTWIDRRKYMHIGGLYIQNSAMIPQKYVNYYTGKTYDYAEHKEAIFRVLFHELGHALDYAYGGAFSDENTFRTAHKADTKPFTEDDKDKLRYFYRSRSETFAHVTAALLGGLDKEESAKILSKFKNCAEDVRQSVFPRLKINISIEDIRRDVYPNYLKKADEKGKGKVSMLRDVIIPPDIAPEILVAQNADREQVATKEENVT